MEKELLGALCVYVIKKNKMKNKPFQFPIGLETLIKNK